MTALSLTPAQTAGFDKEYKCPASDFKFIDSFQNLKGISTFLCVYYICG